MARNLSDFEDDPDSVLIMTEFTFSRMARLSGEEDGRRERSLEDCFGLERRALRNLGVDEVSREERREVKGVRSGVTGVGVAVGKVSLRISVVSISSGSSEEPASISVNSCS